MSGTVSAGDQPNASRAGADSSTDPWLPEPRLSRPNLWLCARTAAGQARCLTGGRVGSTTHGCLPRPGEARLQVSHGWVGARGGRRQPGLLLSTGSAGSDGGGHWDWQSSYCHRGSIRRPFLKQPLPVSVFLPLSCGERDRDAPGADLGEQRPVPCACPSRSGLAPELSSLIGVSHGPWGGSALWIWQQPHIARKVRGLAARAKAAGAGCRAPVWGPVEVRGHHSGVPHCASPWGGLGKAWRSVKAPWSGCSC